MSILFRAVELVSIHAPLTGGDRRERHRKLTSWGFNPRPPHRRRLRSLSPTTQTRPAFQSTPPSQEATGNDPRVTLIQAVSIHAPLTGGDENCYLDSAGRHLFQSTPPSQEATGAGGFAGRKMASFNPRPPHRRRRKSGSIVGAGSAVSIHAPLTGGDVMSVSVSVRSRSFNPRPPHRRRPGLSGHTTRPLCFNPRPPHRRRQCNQRTDKQGDPGFNPRPPHRRRHAPPQKLNRYYVFQSTPPSQEATLVVVVYGLWRMFQSTPPSQEATRRHSNKGAIAWFQSTPPSQEATCKSTPRI